MSEAQSYRGTGHAGSSDCDHPNALPADDRFDESQYACRKPQPFNS